MMNWFKQNRILGLLLVSLTVVSCEGTINTEFGLEDANSSQIMVTKSTKIENCVDTYTLITDSIPSSSLGFMTLGNRYTEMMGWTKASSYTYIDPYDDYFDLIQDEELTEFSRLDSVAIYLQVYDVSYDEGVGELDLAVQKFGIFQAKNFLPFENDKNVDSEDKNYYSNIDVSQIMDDVELTEENALFTFKHNSTESTKFTFTERKVAIEGLVDNLEVTGKGEKFIEALLGAGKELYEFSNTELYMAFAEEFKGVYIAPIGDVEIGETGTAMYFANLRLDLFCKVTDPDADADADADPEADKITEVLSYLFLDDAATTQLGLSRVIHDYTGSEVDQYIVNKEFDAKDKRIINLPIESADKTFVQNMSGLGAYFVFNDNLFQDLEALLTDNGEVYSSINFNRVLLTMSVPDAVSVDDDLSILNVAPYKLGMYYSYKGVRPYVGGVPFVGEYAQPMLDYNYVWEIDYQQKLKYGGELNRVKRRYEMDITVYLNDIFLDYVKNTDTENPVQREIVFAPSYVGLYGSVGSSSDFYEYSQVEIVGSGSTATKGKPKLELTYTLIK